MKILFWFLLFSSFTFSQEIQVLSKQTNKPIPYANVDFLNGKGVSCNKNGKFLFNDTEIDTILVSSIGFEARMISVADMMLSSKVFLKEKITGLDEVLLKSKKQEVLKLKSKPLHVNLDVGGFGYNQLVVTYIPFPKEIDGDEVRIKNILINTTGLRSKKRRYYPFKVNLFSVNKNAKSPNIADSLITGIITSRKKKEKSLVKVNIKDYNIFLPKEGIFVAFETLSKKDYPNDKHYTGEKLIYFQNTKGHNDYAAAVKKLKPKKESKAYSYIQKIQKFKNSKGEDVVHKYWKKAEDFIFDLTLEIEY